MPLVDTSRAIGAVTAVLKERLESPNTGVGKPVSVGRLDQSSGADEHLNLFLYEIVFDPHLKNTPLNEGEKPPAWLVLKYLLTAFESTKESDSAKAHKLLGSAIRVIQQDDLLKLDGLATDTDPLTPNPSELFVTFDESPSDLVARLSQGSDETPRLSIAFQVRPVMIASGEPGDYSLLVGVDYASTAIPTPPDTFIKTPEPVGIDVIPSMGPVIERISAIQINDKGIESQTGNGFEIDEEVAVFGTDMHLANLSVILGSTELAITLQKPDELRFKVDSTIIGASNMSAGSYPVTVALTLAGTGKKRKSNAVIGNLVPTLNTAAIAGAISTPATKPNHRFANIDLTGLLLGKDEDDVVVAFYRDGKTYGMCDEFVAIASPPPLQPSRTLTMKEEHAVEKGKYKLILVVNGQQAPQSPEVDLV
jgi:hypothetical protein